MLAGVALIDGGRLLGSPSTSVIPAAAGLGLHERVVRDAGMIWNQLPTSWRNAPLLGNGSFTTYVQLAENSNAISFMTGRAGTPIESPVSRLDLVLAGTPTSAQWELDLWNAELTGTVSTTRGSVTFSALVHHEHGLLLVSAQQHGGEDAVWQAADSPEGLAWRAETNGTTRLLAAGETRDALQPALDTGLAKLTDSHRQWWHGYYTKSFLSIPDKSAQRFYWAQLYKAASINATGQAAGTEHPIVNGANHAELAGTTMPSFGFRRPDIAFPGAGSRGGRASNAVAAWRLPVIWAGYQHSMNPDVLGDVLHPGLRKAVDFYAGAVSEGTDGRLHLPLTRSPEYADVIDCTYDLSLVRWASNRLIESTRLLGADEPRLDIWRDLAERLTPYHADTHGTLIGAGVGLTKSHPYPSHLHWLHALGEISPDADEATVALARRSFARWVSMPQAWHGSSYVSAASMATTLRWPSAAQGYLTHFLGRAVDSDTELTPNTLYRKGSGSIPNVPLDAGQVLLESVVDSGDGWIDVFPAVPSTWRDASFASLRTRGGFLVDASRGAGRTNWVRVRGGTGQPVVLRHDIEGKVDVRDHRGNRMAWRPVGDGVAALCLADGESATVVRDGSDYDAIEPMVGDVPANGTATSWGLPSAA